MKNKYYEDVTFQEFTKSYFSHVCTLLNKLDLDSLSDFLQAIECARNLEKTIFIAGNGGSAATASHMANDFSVGILKGLHGSKPYRVVSLGDNVPIITAIGDDLGYDRIFISQLGNRFRPGDL
ncbi:MAG: phosphoheptose isomerase, partial [Oligoflexales bacterium]|nr:phosphoheptose isomerase [Oligoflexales bacterium]